MNTLIYILTGLAVVFAIAALIGYGIDKYFERKEKHIAKILKAAGKSLSMIADDFKKEEKKDD